MENLKDSKRYLSKLECYGGENTVAKTFNILSSMDPSDKIKSITVGSGEIIDSIKMCYVSGAETEQYGGNGGTLNTLTLEPDETLIEICGLYGAWWNLHVIKQIEFITSKGHRYTYGTNKYPHTSTPFSIKSPIEFPILAFYGAIVEGDRGHFLSQIGIYVSVTELPNFYAKSRNKLISSLYDPIFLKQKMHIGWSINEDIANQTFMKKVDQVTRSKDYYNHPYEAQYFNAVKDKIESTDLFNFLKGLPKGAVLHLHPSSMGDFKDLLHMAADYKKDICQVRIQYKDASMNEIEHINVDGHAFRWLSQTNDPSYVAPVDEGFFSDYINLSDALNDSQLQQVVYDLMILNKDVMNYESDMWDLFQPVFSRAGTLTGKMEISQNYYNKAFEYLAKEDNLSHVELRSYWNPNNESLENTREHDVLSAANNAGLSLKIIQFNSRGGKDLEKLEADVLGNVVNTGKAIKNNLTSYLCGYDLVGEEDTGATTKFMTNDFYIAFDQLDNYLPPLFFHDGESDLPVNYSAESEDNLEAPDQSYFNNNLVDAYLLNTLAFNNFQMQTARVGHGLELFKTPKLLNDYKKAGLFVELCPISNQILRYVKDLREHPGQSYLAYGLPVSLSSDDPAIYGYQGITYDFWEAVVAWGLDLKMVKLLCYYSLKYSALNEKDKDLKIEAWKEAWDNYILNYIV